MVIALSIVQFALGALFWALGFRLFKLYTIVIGIAVGATVGAFFASLGTGDAALGAAMGAFAGGVVAWPIRLLMVFVAGAALGFLFGAGLGVVTGVPMGVGLLFLGVACAIPVGMLAVKFHRFFLIFLTAFWGGLGMALSLRVWAVGAHPWPYPITPEAAATILLGLVVGAIGIPVQYAWLRRGGTTPEPPPSPPAVAREDEPPPPRGVPVAPLIPMGVATPGSTLIGTQHAVGVGQLVPADTVADSRA